MAAPLHSKPLDGSEESSGPVASYAQPRYWELDPVRFIAAFSVMILHYFARGYAKDDHLSPYHFPEVGPYSMYGYLAVNLFFMISGFVILISAQGKPRGARGAIAFAKSRAVRLYPAYWIACTFTFLLLFFVCPELRPTSIARYLINMTMLNGFFGIGGIDGVYWTLFVELRFYIIVGLILWAGWIRYIEIFLWAWIFVCYANFHLKLRVVDYILFTEFAPWFACGCFYYLCKSSGFGWRGIFGIFLSNAVGLLYAVQDLHRRELHYGPLSTSVLFSLVVLFNLMFLLIGRTREPEKGTVKKKISDALGGASYPLYLLHAYIGYVLFNIAPKDWSPIWVVTSVMTLMCISAFVMWKWVEPAVRRRLRTSLQA